MKLIERFILIAFLTCCFSNVYAGTISGTVSLPSGKVAGAGGVLMSISSARFFSLDSDATTFVTIQQGASSANYSVTIPEDDEFGVIKFECFTGCLDLKVSNKGVWGGSRGVVGESNFLGVVTYAESQNHQVNFSLSNAISFKGSLFLPEGYEATGSEFIFVTARSVLNEEDIFSFENDNSFDQSTFLEEGLSSIDFEFNAPTTATPTGLWTVSFQCFGCLEPVPDAVHFVSNANGGLGSLSDAQAFEFDNQDHSFDILFQGVINKPNIESNAGFLPSILMLLSD